MTPGIPPARPFALSLARAIEPDVAATAAAGGPPPAAPSPAGDSPFADGRYAGANADVAIELRVDRAGCGVISGDVYRVAANSRGYVASFRTAPGTRVAGEGPWNVIGQDEHGRVVQGIVALTAQADLEGSIVGRLR